LWYNELNRPNQKNCSDDEGKRGLDHCCSSHDFIIVIQHNSNYDHIKLYCLVTVQQGQVALEKRSVLSIPSLPAQINSSLVADGITLQCNSTTIENCIRTEWDRDATALVCIYVLSSDKDQETSTATVFTITSLGILTIVSAFAIFVSLRTLTIIYLMALCLNYVTAVVCFYTTYLINSGFTVNPLLALLITLVLPLPTLASVWKVVSD